MLDWGEKKFFAWFLVSVYFFHSRKKAGACMRKNVNIRGVFFLIYFLVWFGIFCFIVLVLFFCYGCIISFLFILFFLSSSVGGTL